MSEDMSTDDALALIPANYRFYKVDASIEGRFSAMLTLTGTDREDWFVVGEVTDASGRDIRPKLYAYGISNSLSGAIIAAVKDVSNV
jgi:hypothetical protein